MRPYERLSHIMCPACENLGWVHMATTRAAVEHDHAFARCRLCSHAIELDELRQLLNPSQEGDQLAA